MVLGRNPAPIPPTLGPIPAPLPTVDVRTMIWSTCGRLFLCLFLYKFLVVGCRCRCCYWISFSLTAGGGFFMGLVSMDWNWDAECRMLNAERGVLLTLFEPRVR